jgi:hypothetical protein
MGHVCGGQGNDFVRSGSHVVTINESDFVSHVNGTSSHEGQISLA